MNDLRQRNLATAHVLLRLIPGILFLFAGLGKFIGGYGGSVAWISGQFEETWLPAFLVVPYAYALPFIEVTLGVLLTLGLFTRSALTVAGLTLLSLAFGKILLGDHPTVSNNMIYVAITAAALALSEFNRCSVDSLLPGFGAGQPED